MIWRWRLKSPAKITFCPPKSQYFAALRHLASPIKGPTNSNPQESLPSESFRNRKRLGQTPKNTFLSPQIVLATLQNCSSDIIALSLFFWCARQPHYFHDKPTFHHMVSVVSNLTHRYGNVKRILDELETVGCVRKPQTLLLLMRIYWCGAMYDMVLEAFEEMRNYGYIPNTYARNIIMDVLFKIRHVDAALRVLEETQAPNFLSFNIAICNLCRLNDVNSVKGVLKSMLMKGYYMNPETYAWVMNCFCKFARLEEALQLLGMMMVLGVPVSVNVWSILIDGFSKSGQIEVAAYLLEKMVEIGCSPNVVTCTSLIKGFLESRMPGKAFEILGTLEAQGCFPDLVLCNVLIDCLSKMGWYHSAFEVFSSLRELRLMPDVYTFSSLVSTICLSRQYVLLPLLTSGLAIQPDLVVCNCLLSYFHKAGCPDGAVKFYNDMIDRGFLPDKYSFAGVLSALCRLGRINEAFNVYQGIIRSYPGADAHIHTIMINELIKSGSFSNATRLFRKAAAEKLPLDLVSYNVAIHGLIRGGQMEEAFALFNQMKEMDVLPNKHSYNMILSGFCRNRNVNMVKHLLQEMVDGNIEMDCHTYKIVKNFPCDSAYNLLLELRNLGLLPKLAQDSLAYEHDTGAYTSFSSLNNTEDVLDFGTSSSDDLSDAVVSVG
ncbi:putative pentatricopeptide repeat-containing protein At1g16830 [Sesamum indicum]|uniref:Pentatricopeptide repeat-containing protein At1g16830 n=1 Tax=Sesamum indicum TaxID=4182 RepID=A0A6I9SRF5_SESIN|nr:putative pentatricopeptide repeat-containing protein At1g16830 [Sesamum indicum]XP_020548206.1 putative pentatricopeptide repeat-containing protein At1g16830 [Sesamum indicum]